MQNNLSEFIQRFVEFNKLSTSSQFDCLVYFLSKQTGFTGIQPKDVSGLFDQLTLPPLSNVPRYLKKNSESRVNKKFFVRKGKYFPTPYCIELVEKEYLLTKKVIQPTDCLFPASIFSDARNYIKKIADETSICYDMQLYNGCSVLLRRLVETLIIEVYERKGLVTQIKDSSGNFFYLKDLIDIIVKENKSINLSRNSKESLRVIKSLGDLSAHNRRYLATKTDVNRVSSNFRIVFEELINAIDYPSWN